MYSSDKSISSNLFLIILILFFQSVFAQEPNRLEQRFEKLDADKDGQLNATEFIWPKLFEKVDKDGNGYITKQEVKQYFKAKKVAKKTFKENTIQSFYDIPYNQIEGIDPKHLSLDIFTNKKEKKQPVLVYVHGGGWQKGDKKATGNKISWFLKKGFILISINYRLYPAGKHPKNIQDVADSIAWIHDNIIEYGGDPDRIILMGHSAGAHLVTLVATDERKLKKAGKSLKIIKGVIELDTNALNIPKLMKRIGTRNAVYSKIFSQNPKLWESASPSTYIKAEKNIPPFLLVYADQKFLKEQQAKEFAIKLKEVGVEAHLFDAADKTHRTVNQDIGKPKEKITQAIMDFIENVLKEKREKEE